MSEGKIKVRAKHVIRRATEPGKAADKEKGTPRIPPKFTDIKPGTMFLTRNQEEFRELMSLGAVEVVKDDDVVEVAASQVEPEDEDDAPKKAPAKKAPAKAKAPAKKPAAKPAATKADGDDGKDLV